MIINQKDIDRFKSKIEYPIDNKTNVCWNWILTTDKNGYGIFWINGKNVRAHRFQYMISFNNFKNIPQDVFVCHTCDNPSCVNPDHLFIGTVFDNNQDKVKKGRSCKGSKHGRSILTENDVQQMLTDIYNNKYQSYLQVAKYYNITTTTVADILRGKTWTHVTNQLQVPLNNIKKIINQFASELQLQYQKK